MIYITRCCQLLGRITPRSADWHYFSYQKRSREVVNLEWQMHCSLINWQLIYKINQSNASSRTQDFYINWLPKVVRPCNRAIRPDTILRRYFQRNQAMIIPIWDCRMFWRPSLVKCHLLGRNQRVFRLRMPMWKLVVNMFWQTQPNVGCYNLWTHPL